jgi:hypothetical protein
MILLKNKTAWKKWSKTFNAGQPQCAPAGLPVKFPCFVYETVASFGYEETSENYLDEQDLLGMVDQLRGDEVGDSGN